MKYDGQEKLNALRYLFREAISAISSVRLITFYISEEERRLKTATEQLSKIET